MFSLLFAALLVKVGGASYYPEYQDIYDSFDVKPSSLDAAAQNIFVGKLVDGGVWTELDRLFILAAHAAGLDSLRNWLDPEGTPAAIVNTPLFTAYQGYTSLLSDPVGYIDANYIPSAGVKFGLNGNSSGFYGRTPQATASAAEYGVYDGANYVKMDSRQNRVFVYNNSAGIESLIYDLSSGGMVVCERNTSALIEYYYNGVSIGTDGSNSVAIPTKTVYILCWNNNGTPANRAVDEQISMAYFGANLGAAKQLILYNAFQDLMIYYGTQV